MPIKKEKKKKKPLIKDVVPVFLSNNHLETVYGLGDYKKFWKF